MGVHDCARAGEEILRSARIAAVVRPGLVCVGIRGRAEMTTSPRVSIVTPFLDSGTFLEPAIESVLAQTFRKWELLLVDDGSTDGSSAVARRFAVALPDKVKYLTHPHRENRGASASRNLGIENAAGEYLAFLDADDVYLPHKL